MASLVRLLTQRCKLQKLYSASYLLLRKHVVHSEVMIFPKAAVILSDNDRCRCLNFRRTMTTTKQAETLPPLLGIYQDSHTLMSRLEMAKEKGGMTVEESLELLTLTRRLMPYEPQERCSELIDRVWSGLLSLGVELTTKHFTLLLFLRKDNGEQVSPENIFMEIHNRGLVVDQELCEALIDVCAGTGDMEGVSNTIVHMKENDLELNIDILSSMMKGHVLNGDEDGVNDVQSAVENLGLFLNRTGYTKLMSAYAQMGDMEKIENVLKECSEAFSITMRPLFRVYSVLVKNGYHDHASKFLASWTDLRFDVTYHTQYLYLILGLLCRGHRKEAFNLLVWTLQNTTDCHPRLANTFCRFAVRSDMPVAEILKMMTEINRRRLGEVWMKDIVNAAWWYRKLDLLISLNYRTSPIGQARIREHLPNVLRSTTVTDIYRAACIPRNGDVITTILVFGLLNKGESFSSIQNKFKEMGIRMRFSKEEAVLATLDEVALQKFYENFKTNKYTMATVLQLVDKYCQTGKLSQAEELLDSVEGSEEELSPEHILKLVKILDKYGVLVERLEKYREIIKKPDVVMRLLETAPKGPEMVVSLQSLADEDPDVFDKVENLILTSEDAKKSLQKLVQYYLCSGQYDRLRQNLQDHDIVKKLNPAFILRGLQRNLYRGSRRPLSSEVKQELSPQQMEEASLEFLEFVKLADRSRLPGIYNHLILLKVGQNDWQAALQYFEKCRSEGFELKDINFGTLKRMGVLLVENSQPLPWTEEDMNARNAWYQPKVVVGEDFDTSGSDSTSEEKDSSRSESSDSESSDSESSDNESSDSEKEDNDITQSTSLPSGPGL